MKKLEFGISVTFSTHRSWCSTNQLLKETLWIQRVDDGANSMTNGVDENNLAECRQSVYTEVKGIFCRYQQIDRFNAGRYRLSTREYQQMVGQQWISQWW